MESAALIQGLSMAVSVMRPSRPVRAALSAASIAPHGLSRMSALIACEAIQTTANTATPMGTVRMLSNQDQSMAATWMLAVPVAISASVGAGLAAIILERPAMVRGTTAPAATRPVAL